MLQIKNYKEKKLIMEAFCRENKHIGKEYIWQVWNYHWPEDFPQDDHSTQLKLHDNHVVYEFSEHKNEQPVICTVYDDVITEVYVFAKDNMSKDLGALQKALYNYRICKETELRRIAKRKGFFVDVSGISKHPFKLALFVLREGVSAVDASYTPQRRQGEVSAQKVRTALSKSSSSENFIFFSLQNSSKFLVMIVVLL